MAEPTIGQLIADLDRQMEVLNRQAAHLDKTIEGLAAEQAKLRAQISDLMVARVIAVSTGNRLHADENPVIAVKPTITEAAEATLREQGGEADMQLLVQLLTEQGVLRGKERRATLSTQLLRHKDRFHSPRPGRWALGPAPRDSQAAKRVSEPVAPWPGMEKVNDFVRRLVQPPPGVQAPPHSEAVIEVSQ
jgi:hypothetical protein